MANLEDLLSLVEKNKTSTLRDTILDLIQKDDLLASKILGCLEYYFHWHYQTIHEDTVDEDLRNVYDINGRDFSGAAYVNFRKLYDYTHYSINYGEKENASLDAQILAICAVAKMMETCGIIFYTYEDIFSDYDKKNINKIIIRGLNLLRIVLDNHPLRYYQLNSCIIRMSKSLHNLYAHDLITYSQIKNYKAVLIPYFYNNNKAVGFKRFFEDHVTYDKKL